jgi:transposase InsO family protein
MLNILDEFTHECLAIRVARRLKSIDVIDLLSDLFILRGIPGHIRSDNGPEFVARVVQDWIAAVGARTAYIERGSPWENGFIESFNARLRDELLDGEIFYTLREAQIVTRAGGVTTTPSGHTPRSATRLPPRKCSCRHLPHGRLRNPDQLRRPCSRWRRGQP